MQGGENSSAFTVSKTGGCHSVGIEKNRGRSWVSAALAPAAKVTGPMGRVILPLRAGWARCTTVVATLMRYHAGSWSNTSRSDPIGELSRG